MLSTQMENEPRNLTIGTLMQVAHALDSRVEIKLVWRKGTKAGAGRESKPAGFEPKAAAPGTRLSKAVRASAQEIE